MQRNEACYDAEARRQIDLFVKRNDGRPQAAKLGTLDTFIKQDVDGCFITLEQDGAEKSTKLSMEPYPLTRQRAIVCCGTTCVLTKTPASPDWHSVTKFSWASDKRRPEDRAVRLPSYHQHCRDALQADISKILIALNFSKHAKHDIFSQSFSQHQPPSLPESFSELGGLSVAEKPSRKRKAADSGKRSAKKSKSNGQRSQLQNEGTCNTGEAQGTSLLSPSDGPSITVSFAALSFLRAPGAHQSLFVKGKMHRDISENNIIITDPKQTNGFTGMMIDLDLEVSSGRSGARCPAGSRLYLSTYSVLRSSQLGILGHRQRVC
ncbi:hypothetical protein V8E54_007863 [Elaphomyces granulatus]